jgi:hypothetical protein
MVRLVHRCNKETHKISLSKSASGNSHLHKRKNPGKMEKLTKTAFGYYSTVSVIALPVIAMLLIWLAWPATATAVLGVVLYIHILALAKLFRDLYEKAERKGLTTAVSRQIKSIFELQGANQESEA